MSASNTPAQEKVLSLLEFSFPQAFPAPEPDAGTQLDLPADAIVLEDDNDLRSNLFLFSAADLVDVLPAVLADLLTTEDRSGIEAVISALDVSSEPEEQFQRTKACFGPEVAEKLHKDDQELYLDKLDSFSLFNQRQASAIYHWLILVSGWPELEAASTNLETATQYWMTRSKVKTS